MMEEHEKTSTVYDLPTEVLLFIFTFLPGKQLIRLREVCSRWRNVVDRMTRNDSFWRKHCQSDYKDLYKVARSKARVGMLWFNVYRSLSLWPHLKRARLIRDEFAPASSVIDEIIGFEILQDGIIGVHKRGAIVYYDIETLEPAKRSSIAGNYLQYAENADSIMIRGCHLHLFVIRKILHNPSFETNVTFDAVKLTLLVEKDLYYVDLNNDIYLCKLKDGDLSTKLLKHSEESVMCLGYTNQLNFLTFQRNIYSIVKGNLVLICKLDDTPNILHELYKYGLIEKVDWRSIFHWMCYLRRPVPVSLQEILTVRLYGDVAIVGCNWGVMHIYYAPFTNGEFDIYNAEPVKQFIFMEPSDCPVLATCPILKVDVLESEEGHTIIVAMPKKIAVLDFVHSFKRTRSVTMLPYSDVQQVKLIHTGDVDL